MEEFIKINDNGKISLAIITKNKPNCLKDGEHSWDGEEIITFYNYEKTLKRSEFEILSDEEKHKLNPESGQVSCSKCGIGYMSYDNPYYSEI